MAYFPAGRASGFPHPGAHNRLTRLALALRLATALAAPAVMLWPAAAAQAQAAQSAARSYRIPAGPLAERTCRALPTTPASRCCLMPRWWASAAARG